ncbi:DEAD/DEAH box helicase [Paucibacter sp. R3-3]|uniref:DEAD/DEAH box helicase n=1 Tax=Roseateles agri TaxID=3098619 RepID=A0ABU5DCI3_9BURK|nr:DEAD/DEAH box helicase [Paucibacter sp. R3-3]MDY0743460.1 DEAD/DEAH box helicase [Paucibacter sp. R3-3]
MSSKEGKSPIGFTTLGGRQLGTREELLAELRRLRGEDAEDAPAPASVAPPPEADLQAVQDALLLIGGIRGAAGLALWLEAVEVRSEESGKPLRSAQVTACLRELVRQGRAYNTTSGTYEIDLADHAERLETLLLRPEAKRWWLLLGNLIGGGHGPEDRLPYWMSYRGEAERLALLRLMLYSRVDGPTLRQRIAQSAHPVGTPPELVDVLLHPWMPRAVEAMDPELRDETLSQALDLLPPGDPRLVPVRRWLHELAKSRPESLQPALLTRLAEASLLALDLPGARTLMQGIEGPLQAIIDAAERTQRGEWVTAASSFEAALKQARQLGGSRRGALRPEVSRLYLVSLLAQPDPKAWLAARKYSIGESGSRNPSPRERWGLWAHVIGVRLGEEALEPGLFDFQSGFESREAITELVADLLLLAAWLGKPAPGWDHAMVQQLGERLVRAEQLWHAALLAQAAERLELGPLAIDLHGNAPPVSFLGAQREPWRDALAAIAALGDEGQTLPGKATSLDLAWQLTLDGEHRVLDLEPLERSTGTRGAAKFKPISLSKLKKGAGGATPQDNAVLRHIERAPWGGVNSWQLDVASAAQALVGHPAVMFADAPGVWVELSEAQPELEVQRRPGDEDGNGGKDQFVFRIEPPLIATAPMSLSYFPGRDENEAEKRNAFRIVRDGPQQARLIRIGPAQRRVAELVAQGWSVPADATAELGAALQVLSGHFQLHSDAAAGQQVPGDNRLHARLVPLGDGLQLQLVAQPFGNFGPAVTPGQGRARLMCMHEGLSLATERDLAAEREHRRAVIEALPFLDPEQAPASAWLLADAEEALRAVELLPALPGVAALDWPKGKPLRVKPVESAALSVNVSSGRDWLAVDGELAVDEQRVLNLQQLIKLARDSKSRFVRMGEGDYLALSEQLRQQLRDLDALAVARKDQLQLPLAAASWLDDTLDGMALEGDKPWLARMDALAEAGALRPQVPAGLRAELRSYQAEGFCWMSRLAAAGLGACLADDMGLGKTVQTLALLVARADTGPALVLAPTSVCGNWLAECGVFAPGLRATLYGDEPDRAAQIQRMGPGDVLIASYALAQIDAELFAPLDWGTLVMDEAQALKNAATKRAKSVAEFKAGFRLALSGTPVENRLSDLWSIMNLINPGLLGTAAQFAERFATPIERQQDPAARQRLRRLVSPFLLRRTKSQVLQDLPPRTEIVHLVQPSLEEKHFLEALRRSAQEAVVDADGQPAPMQVLAELMRLRRAACDPRLVAPELGLVGSKLAEFERIVRELVDGSHKALVFSQFTDYLGLLAERLDAIGLPYQYLDGSTPAAERTKRVAAFQRGEGEVFLISLKAGGFGLNLTMADYVLIVDPWWNPAAEDQATGRAHRMGQQRPVTVYRLVTAGSIEESIIELHRDKRGLAEGVLEGQEEASVLDAKALAELLRG